MQSISSCFQPHFERFQKIVKMDASHYRIDSSSSMSISETHSEKTASDIEEDFKHNIPSYNDEGTTLDNAGTTLIESCTSNYDELLAQHKIEAIDDDDENRNNYSNYSAHWDLDEGCVDDGVGSDYSAYSVGEGNQSFYLPSPMSAAETSPMPNNSNSTYHHHQHQHQHHQEALRHSPNSMLLRPPSSSTLNYHYPHSQASTHMRNFQAPHAFAANGGSSTTQATIGQQAHLHGRRRGGGGDSDSIRDGGGGGNNGGAGAGVGVGAGAGYRQQATPAYSWHPNAPYGTGAYYGPHGTQRYSHCNSSAYPMDPVMDMLQLSNSGREARNRAEKNRRDKLNGSIQELSTMVPHVTESPRRVDKTAVLRFAAHGLRLQYVFGETTNEQPMQITEPLMKLLDSFFITVTCHGQIVLISSSIEQHLGHCQADLYGQSLQHITHPEDHKMLKQQLIPKGLENLFDIQPDDESGEPRPRTQAEEEYIDRKLREDRRSFTVRLARAGPRSEPTTYEVVKLDGSFRRSDAAPRGLKTSTFPSTLQLIRRTRGRDDAIPLHTISGNDIVMIAIARIIRPPKIINRVLEANTLEYKTRHLIDGRIIDCDQRIGLVAGYMTDEVRNLSPFTFMHQDDVRWVIVALRQMYDCNSSYGESTYRLLTRNGNFIYLTSKGYLEIDKETNKVHSFVCVNTLLDETEGRRRIQEMKNKFSIIIQTKIPQSSVDVPASEQQLVKAVLCLIQDLQKSPTYDDTGDGDGDDDDNNNNNNNNNDDYVVAVGSGKSHGKETIIRAPPPTDARRLTYMMSPHRTAEASSSMRMTRTPPLALVPPETASVKTSISKSVSVVNVTAGKNLMRDANQQQRNRSPMPSSPAVDSTTEATKLCANSVGCDSTACECCERSNIHTPIAAVGNKRSASNVSSSCSDNEDVAKPKQLRLDSENQDRAITSNSSIDYHNESKKYCDYVSAAQKTEITADEHTRQQIESIVNNNNIQMKDNSSKAITKTNLNTTKTSKPRSNQDNIINNNNNDLKPR